MAINRPGLMYKGYHTTRLVRLLYCWQIVYCPQTILFVMKTIKEIDGKKPPRFAASTEFWELLKKRTDIYFETVGTRNATSAMIVKSLVLAITAVVAWCVLVSLGNNIVVLFLSFAVLGITRALMGFNISHDAMHGALSKSERMNKIIGLSFDVQGINSHMWDLLHNRAHHTYTNVDGLDVDLGPSPNVLRLSPHQAYHWMHKHQYWYAWLLYPLATFFWVYFKDFIKMIFQRKKRIGIWYPQHTAMDYAKLAFFKLVHYAIYLVVPLVVIDLPVGWILLALFSMYVVEALIAVPVFMLAHAVEGPEFPLPNEKGEIEHDWKVHQILTTMNFATKSKVVTWLCGGLNHQIEHHLFPKVCHIHYPQLAVYVRQTCQEFGIRYDEAPTLGKALRLHQKHLKKMGQPQ